MLFQAYTTNRDFLRPSNERIIELLQKPDHKKVTKAQPSTVDFDSMFIVNCEGTLTDISCDGNGVFKNAGTFYWVYDQHGRCIREKHRDGRQPTKPNHFLVAKTYYQHRWTPSFRKSIVHIENVYSRLINNLVMLIYRFDGRPTPVKLQPHGHSKTNALYTRVKPSVIRSLGATPLPRKALAEHITEHGGIGGIAKELHPRPNRVVRNASHPKSTATQVVDWDYLLELCNDPDTVVRSVSQHPEPTVLLATQQHLKDLVRFSCGEKAQPVTVDPTFNLGHFYVTPVTYRNQLLESRRSATCKMAQCGPVLIHYSKTKSAYLQLFQQLRALCPGIEGLRAIGTDGEENLVAALKEVFPHTTHLRCYRHFEANLSSKLRSLSLPQYTNTIIEELYTLVSSDDLDLAFTELTNTWEERSPAFRMYLQERYHIIADCLHKTVVKQAGVDDTRFYTNASESINRKIKSFLGGTKHNVTHFIDHLTAFFTAEVQTAEDAYLGTSDTHRISKEYHQLSERPSSDANFLKMCHSFNLDENSSRGTLDTQSFNSPFDILPDECDIGCHIDLLRSMFQKADRYLVDQWVCKAPASSTADVVYIARSVTSSRFHQVTVRRCGQVKCECPSWKANNICAHTIASAQMNGTLYSHIAWLRTTKAKKRGYQAFTQRVNTDTAGLKDHQKKRRRSTTKSADSPTTSSASPTCPPCPTDHSESMIVVAMAEHPRVKRCEGCKQPIGASGIAIGIKVYRTYRSPKTGKQSMTLKREWAYFHCKLFCTSQYSPSADVHCCYRHRHFMDELHVLTQNGFVLK